MSARARLVRAVNDQLRQVLAPSRPFPGLVVAVSGGPDSVALLRAVLEARGEEPAPMVIAHLDHLLRGEESAGDAQFVAGLAECLQASGEANLHLVAGRADVGQQARAEGDNLESTARRVRYGWLAEVARTWGIGTVATGHTASDQAETVLHHLLRGTGLAGLRGIAPRTEIEAGITLVRPLLRVSRDDVLAYLEEVGQAYRTDSSNSDLRFRRNRVRHELLPLLRRGYNPRLDEVLARLAGQADEVCRDEEEQGRGLLARAELPRAGGRVILDVRPLAQERGRIATAALRLVWQREGWRRGGMGYEDWQRLLALVRASEGAADLPGGIHARRRGHVLQLGPHTGGERG